MKRKSIVAVLVLALLLALALSGTALGWAHGKGAKDAPPILDHYTTQYATPNSTYVTFYWDTDGAKPFRAVGVASGFTSSVQIKAADLKVGYKRLLLSNLNTSIHLETRKGIESNSFSISLP